MLQTTDLIGQKFNRLLVIEFAGYKLYNKKAKTFWKCLCDCGNEKIITRSSLITKSTQSCGCLIREILKERHEKMKLPKGEASCNFVEGTYKRSAKKRNLEWNLTREQFRYFTKQNCHYCGAEPGLEGIRKFYINTKLNGNYIYNGIDRVDNTKGYSIQNCVTACRMCNISKNNHSYEDFKKWIQRLIDFNKENI